MSVKVWKATVETAQKNSSFNDIKIYLILAPGIVEAMRILLKTLMESSIELNPDQSLIEIVPTKYTEVLKG